MDTQVNRFQRHNSRNQKPETNQDSTPNDVEQNEGGNDGPTTVSCYRLENDSAEFMHIRTKWFGHKEGIGVSPIPQTIILSTLKRHKRNEDLGAVL